MGPENQQIPREVSKEHVRRWSPGRQGLKQRVVADSYGDVDLDKPLCHLGLSFSKYKGEVWTRT
jgi:hypothetical protein